MYVLCVRVCECMGCECMYMRVSVCMKREKKERQRRRERGKIKPRFLLSHFQLCEVRATLQRSIELNFNPASSYTHLLYAVLLKLYIQTFTKGIIVNGTL